MDNQVRIELRDYRSVKDKFDRIVSVGAFEHFGKKFYKGFDYFITKFIMLFVNR